MAQITISFILYILLTLSGLFGLFQTITKISFPQKWVWFVGFSIITITGLLNSLYQYGGVYIILLPVLYPLKVFNYCYLLYLTLIYFYLLLFLLFILLYSLL